MLASRDSFFPSKQSQERRECSVPPVDIDIFNKGFDLNLPPSAFYKRFHPEHHKKLHWFINLTKAGIIVDLLTFPFVFYLILKPFLLYAANIMLSALDSKGRSANYQIVKDRNPNSIHYTSSWDSFIPNSHTQIGKNTANRLQLLGDSAWQVSCLELCASMSTSHQCSPLEQKHVQSSDIRPT